MSVQTPGEILAGQTAGSAASALQVYWNQPNPVPGYNAATDAINPRKYKIKTVSISDALNDWYNWSDGERAAFGERLYKLGLISDANDYGAAQALWQKAVQEAANFYTYSGRRVTPWDVVTLFAGASPNANVPKTTTNKSTSVKIPSPQEAEAAVKTIFQSALGRDPTDGELARYGSILVAKAKANPTVTTTTTTTDKAGNTTSRSSTSGGYDPNTTLQEPVQQTDEYGAYQAATTYFNALTAAIGNPG